MKNVMNLIASVIFSLIGLIGLYVVISFGYTMFLKDEAETRYYKDMASSNFITAMIIEYDHSKEMEELNQNQFDILNLRAFFEEGN